MWRQSEKEAQCRGSEVLVLLGTPIESLVLEDGYNNIDQNSGRDEPSILLEEAAANLVHLAGMVMSLQTAAPAQLGPGQVVAG